ncbi:hypothetical protein T484DRAFT_1985429 [Baffinella frigidus]|nr:hypothetical protein T484DRAFT_1985429 [Cryptophyta sp. CCMP2293]
MAMRAPLLVLVCFTVGAESFSTPAMSLMGAPVSRTSRRDLGRSAAPCSLKMQEEASKASGTLLSRRTAAWVLAASTVGAFRAYAEEPAASPAASPAAAPEAGSGVCNKMLGCEIKGPLAPPKRVFKDIFEEERERAKEIQAVEDAERKKSQRTELLVLQDQFSQIQKGKADLEKEMKGAIAKTSEGGAEEQKAAWDDVRRMSRLYDTGLRKDGMDQAQGRIGKMRLTFDKGAANARNKELNQALTQLDKAGKKQDVSLADEQLGKALTAVDAWLALRPFLDL